MTLPTPDRNLPDTDDTGPPGPTGGDYADEVAAEVERIWDLVPNALLNVGGTANAITAECDPPLIKDVQHGQLFWLVPTGNNAAGGVTIDIDSRGAVDVLAYDGSALEEDDLVTGSGVVLVGSAVGSPVVTELRLTHPTIRQLLALAQANGAPLWEQIGDSGSLGTVAQVEFSFTAGRYSEIVLVYAGLSTANSSTGINTTLRNASTAIVTLTSATTTSGTIRNGIARFVPDLVSATKFSFGFLRQADDSNGVGADATGSGSNATAPDRVRVAASSGNLDAGRVVAYGLLATAP